MAMTIAYCLLVSSYCTWYMEGRWLNLRLSVYGVGTRNRSLIHINTHAHIIYFGLLLSYLRLFTDAKVVYESSDIHGFYEDLVSLFCAYGVFAGFVFELFFCSSFWRKTNVSLNLND